MVAFEAESELGTRSSVVPEGASAPLSRGCRKVRVAWHQGEAMINEQ